MIRIRRVGRKPDPYIPTATMADIVFLLIIFFIVTYNIEVDKAKVQLPRTTVRTDVPRDAAYVSVDTEGIIRVSSGKETSVPVSAVEEVQTFAQNVVAQTPDKPFVVKADKNTRFQIIDKVLDALKQARVRTIFLLSEQRTVSDKT
ncbi:MAG: biopolymer transporter ExbD [Thermoanaerobaculum sp.]|nr:biopolymer transporter ExbD [Thermoanaerobaculum sp.]MDW7968119.1 biopolymer transporter ExbD [Thermoanaerobaculum sp.]